MATTIAELREEVTENLTLEGLEAPSRKRIMRALNRAKNEIVALLELIEPLRFTAQLDYDVESGDTHLDLPGFGDASDETKWRRILGLAKVESGSNYEANVCIYDRRDEGLRSAPAGFWMYREANKLYFSDIAGASGAMTLRLRYNVLVADATEGSGVELDATYGYIPDDWTDLLTTRATMFLMPAKHGMAAKWGALWAERKAVLTMAASRTIHTGPSYVKMVDEW